MRLAPLLLLPQLPVWMLLAVAGMQLSAAVDARTQATAEAAHSREQLSRMEAALRLTLDLETGVRGYVLLPRPELLQPYQRGRADEAELVDGLRALVGGRPEALAAAAKVDRARAAGEPLGPLAGVPVALKDVLTYAGAPTTAPGRRGWGSAHRAGCSRPR